MKRISILLNVLFFCHIFTVAQSVSDWQKVRYISGDENIAVFTSEGEASKKSEVGKDAKCRLFYALFYKGVIGFNDTQPLITKDNRLYTDPFFNESQRYESYILDMEGADDTHKENRKHLWRDPWGNRYVIIINTQLTDEIPNPADTNKSLAAKAIVYSYGPNGEDNNAKNILYDVGSSLDATCDDIASWH